MTQEHFVYVLQSISSPGKTYIGMTTRLEERLSEHNDGSQIYSHRYAPWKRIAYFSFPARQIAAEFEKYLKTPSGKAFLKKHLLNFLQ